MTTERVLCMCFGYVPIFIGGGDGLRVEQRGPVRGANNPSLKDYLRSQKKWKIALSCDTSLLLIQSGDLPVYINTMYLHTCKYSDIFRPRELEGYPNMFSQHINTNMNIHVSTQNDYRGYRNV